MASAYGRARGRTPVHRGSSKTVEGTAAGALSTLAGWAAALLAERALLAPAAAAAGGAGALPRCALSAAAWLQLAAATLGACLLEAATSQLDNILIPLYYLPHCLLAARAA